MTTKRFQKIILSWYKTNRRDLPWRAPVRWKNNLPLPSRKLPAYLTPYHILVSEIMLQQTQIPRVLAKYPLFLKSFPTIESLAKAETEKLFSVWQGMGYWRRALYLRTSAKEIVKKYNGAMPSSAEELQKLPGIGHYTSHAVGCFAFQNPEAFVDTNIRRVFIHFFFPDKKDVPILSRAKSANDKIEDPRRPSKIKDFKGVGISDAEILAVAQKNMWKENPREWHYALMDYGSIVLGKKHELNYQSKHFHKQSRFEGSFRSFRSAVVSLLLADGPSSLQKIAGYLRTIPSYESSSFAAEQIIEALKKDRVVECKKNLYRLRG